MVTSPLLVTEVTALVLKVAVPVGIVAGFQLLFSSYSLGSPPWPPTQVASWACAEIAPKARTALSAVKPLRPISRAM
jgi:hypothetical protein